MNKNIFESVGDRPPVEGRTYGGGLHKIEPKELASVQVKDLPQILLHTLERLH